MESKNIQVNMDLIDSWLLKADIDLKLAELIYSNESSQVKGS